MESKFENINDVLHFIQKNLHAPRSQYNKFGNYYFRSCEDIFEGVKKVMPEGASVTVTDDIVMVGNRIYVKATAKLCWGNTCVENTAFAREPENMKGNSDPQATGATSSYARKYALNGLFMIDDVKDADTNEQKEQQSQKEPKQQPKAQQVKKVDLDEYNMLREGLELSQTIDELQSAFKNVYAAKPRMEESDYKTLEKIKDDLKVSFSNGGQQ